MNINYSILSWVFRLFSVFLWVISRLWSQKATAQPHGRTLESATRSIPVDDLCYIFSLSIFLFSASPSVTIKQSQKLTEECGCDGALTQTHWFSAIHSGWGFGCRQVTVTSSLIPAPQSRLQTGKPPVTALKYPLWCSQQGCTLFGDF